MRTTLELVKRFAILILPVLVIVGCERAPVSAPVKSDLASVPSQILAYSAQTSAAADAQKSHTSRPIYPFSLVPGGAYSAAELSRAFKVSKTLQTHYAELDFHQLHLSRLPKDTPAYVSYRRDGKIYWTRNKLMLRSGELVLTDGRYLLRARCANQISLAPRDPVETQISSVEDQLETPVAPEPVKYARLEEFRSELAPPLVAPPPTTVTVPKPTMPLPPGQPPHIFPVCTTCGRVPPNPPAPPPPVPVPEPGTVAFIAVSLLLMAPALLREKRPRK